MAAAMTGIAIKPSSLVVVYTEMKELILLESLVVRRFFFVT